MPKTSNAKLSRAYRFSTVDTARYGIGDYLKDFGYPPDMPMTKLKRGDTLRPGSLRRAVFDAVTGSKPLIDALVDVWLHWRSAKGNGASWYAVVKLTLRELVEQRYLKVPTKAETSCCRLLDCIADLIQIEKDLGVAINLTVKGAGLRSLLPPAE